MEIEYLEGGMEIRVEYVCAESAESAECGQLFFFANCKKARWDCLLIVQFSPRFLLTI